MQKRLYPKNEAAFFNFFTFILDPCPIRPRRLQAVNGLNRQPIHRHNNQNTSQLSNKGTLTFLLTQFNEITLW